MRVGRLARLLGLSVGVALASCGDAGGDPPTEECDADGDGVDAQTCGGDDCDDEDPSAHPGRDEQEEWTLGTLPVGAMPGYGHSALVDGQGVAHVCVVEEGAPPSYLSDAGGAWVTTQLGGDPVWGFDCAVGLTPAGEPRAVFQVNVDAGVHARLAYVTGTGWFTAQTPIGSSSLDMVVTADGASHLFHRNDLARLSHSRFADGAFATDTIDTTQGSGRSTSAVLGSDGQMRVLYGNDPSNALVLAVGGPGWLEEAVAHTIPSDEHLVDLWLTASPSGELFVALDNYDEETLHLLSRSSAGAWTDAPLGAETPVVGSRPSIYVDAEGQVHAAYYDAADRLSYVVGVPGAWGEVEQVATDGDPTYPVVIAAGAERELVLYARTGGSVGVASRTIPDGRDDDCDGVVH